MSDQPGINGLTIQESLNSALGAPFVICGPMLKLTTTAAPANIAAGDIVGNATDFTAAATSVGRVYSVSQANKTIIITQLRVGTSDWANSDNVFESSEPGDTAKINDTTADDSGYDLAGASGAVVDNTVAIVAGAAPHTDIAYFFAVEAIGGDLSWGVLTNPHTGDPMVPRHSQLEGTVTYGPFKGLSFLEASAGTGVYAKAYYVGR